MARANIPVGRFQEAENLGWQRDKVRHRDGRRMKRAAIFVGGVVVGFLLALLAADESKEAPVPRRLLEPVPRAERPLVLLVSNKEINR